MAYFDKLFSIFAPSGPGSSGF